MADTNSVFDVLIISLNECNIQLPQWWQVIPTNVDFLWLKKHCGSNHAKSGKLLDIFLQMWRNKQNVFQELVVPVDNYNVLRRYSYLSCWYAYQHLKSTMGRDLGFCVYSIYAYNSYELLDKHLKLHSSSPVCISVCDVHTAFGFTVSLPSQTFIQQNLIPWIEIKDVGEVDNFIGEQSF